MPQIPKPNLWPHAPENQFVYYYKGRTDRFVAYRRYEDPDYGKTPLNKYKRFNKSCLFYSIEDAINWLNSLPQKISRPLRYDRNAPVEP